MAGVPGAAKPGIHVTPSGLVGGLDPQLETSTAMHPTAIGMSSALFKILRLTFTSYHAVGFIHRPTARAIRRCSHVRGGLQLSHLTDHQEHRSCRTKRGQPAHN